MLVLDDSLSLIGIKLVSNTLEFDKEIIGSNLRSELIQADSLQTHN